MNLPQLYEKYTNKFSRFLYINNTFVHIREEGEGQPIIFIHGAFSSLHTFNRWTKIFTSEKYKTIRYDIPGFGLTGPNPENDYSIEMHVDFLKKIIDTLGIENCYIAGSSLGGWIAWEFALKYPKYVHKLILLDSAGFLEEKSVPSPFKLARTPFADMFIKYAVRKGLMEYYIKDVYKNKKVITPELIERYYELFSREGNPKAFWYLVNQKHKNNTNKLKKIKCPTLILWGEEDVWIPVEYGYRFNHEIPGSQFIIYNKTGHLPMEEIPQNSALDVISFINNTIL